MLEPELALLDDYYKPDIHHHHNTKPSKVITGLERQ
jgi:hypothetical protein